MAKPKVLRNSETHKVKVQEGSNIAQRKPAPKAGPREETEPSPAVTRKPVLPSNVKAVVRLTPVLHPRSNASAPAADEPTLQGPSNARLISNTSQRPAPQARETAESLWEPDELVLQRINGLRELNTQLAEQIQGFSKPSSKGALR